jgi:hypothetical protein
MAYFMKVGLIPRSKIIHMDFFFSNKKLIEEKKKQDIKKKERIKQLKIKEPINKTYWNFGDIFYDVKERIKELKIKEPVKISTWTDEF